MRYLYLSTKPLDERAKSKYLLSDELLMENAANALLELVRSLTHKGSVITIVCGSGDNGADGYTLARKLQRHYITRIYAAKEPKSPLCKLQSERAQVAGCEWVKKLLPCDVVVDCLFGSGFAGELGAETIKLLEQMNECARIKIACDIPSGLNLQGRVESYAFSADYTLSMGALKVALFSDMAKDLTGKVLVGDLGVSRELFEVQSPFYLLEESDMRLPQRTKQNCHKGTFGHIAIISGEKPGAAMICAMSGLRMGAGLVSVVDRSCALGLESQKRKDNNHTALESKELDSSKSVQKLESTSAKLDSSQSSLRATSEASNEAIHNTKVDSSVQVESSAKMDSKEASPSLFAEETSLCRATASAPTRNDKNSSALDCHALPINKACNDSLLDSSLYARSSQHIEIMHARSIPPNANVLCLGMGLGSGFSLEPSVLQDRLCVLDADVFYEPSLLPLLESTCASNLVLTPHPKEFHALLHLCELFSGDIAEVAHSRFELALRFSQAYKAPTLLLKGANPIIAHNAKLYINPIGTSALAKGGSGDVLSGVIASYLAQGFSPLDSAIYASLAHAKAATKEKNSYALTPLRLIEHLGTL